MGKIQPMKVSDVPVLGAVGAGGTWSGKQYTAHRFVGAQWAGE